MNAAEIMAERYRFATELHARGLEQGEAIGELLDVDRDELDLVMQEAHMLVAHRVNARVAEGHAAADTPTYLIASAVLVGMELAAAASRLEADRAR